MKKVILEYQQYSTFKNNVLLISTGINNLNIFKIMAKNVKYYGVFAKSTVENKLPKELVDMLSKNGELVGLKNPIIKVFVFDNGLVRIECALDVGGAVMEAIDALGRTLFMSQVEQLKKKYPDK